MNEILKEVNVDLLVPLFIVFAVLRTNKVFAIKQRLLQGLRLFIPLSERLYTQKRVPALTTDEHDLIKTSSLQLGLIEIDLSIHKCHFISVLPFFNMYENLVNLTICVVLSHMYYSWFHCFFPEASHGFWGGMLAFGLIVIALQCQFRVLIKTDFNAFETNVGVYLGLVTVLGTFFLLQTQNDVFEFELNKSLMEISVHVNELTRQLSHDPMQLPIDLFINVWKALFSLTFGVACGSMVIPALRFSRQVHLKPSTKLWIWVDQLAPVVAATILTPSIYLHFASLGEGTCNGLSLSESNVCVGGQSNFKIGADSLFSLQLTALITVVVLRICSMKPQLQVLLDATVHTVSAHIKTGEASVGSVHKTLKVRLHL